MRISDWSSDVCSSDLLTLTSTIAYMDARYDVDLDDVGGSLRGNRLPNAPQWNVTLGGEYKAPLGDGTLSLRTDVSWRDSVFFNPNNNPLFSGNATTLVNGGVAWQPGSEAWEIALYGRNLNDRSEEQTSEIQTLMRISHAHF